MIHLNHAGTSWPKPAAVREAAGRALSAAPDTWAEDLGQDHAAVCRALGVADPSRLLVTSGGTAALGIGIADHAWAPGDRALLSGREHHALHRPLQQLAALGVDVEAIPGRAGEPVDLEALRRALASGGVRLVAMTAACNVTGECLPVPEITGLAREYGALSLIDAAQIAGWVDLDLASYGADLVAFTGHKGPQSPWGVGGLYVAPGVSLASPRAACEIPSSDDATPCAPMPGYCDAGSVNRPALAGLAAGFAWLAEPGREDRLRVARSGIARLQERLAPLPGVRVHGDPDPGHRMPTLALTVEGRALEEIGEALRARQVFASIGQQCAPLAHETLGTIPEGVLRLSVGPATAAEEIEAAADHLGAVLLP